MIFTPAVLPSNSDTKLLMPTENTTNSIRRRFIYDPRALTSGKQVKFEGMSNNVCGDEL